MGLVFRMFTNTRRPPQRLRAQTLNTVTPAAMLLLHLLLYVFIHHQLHAKELGKESAKAIEKHHRQLDHHPHVKRLSPNHIPGVSKKAELPKDTNYVFKYIEQCPDIGYYFGRDPALNKVVPDPCYLCFCHRGKYALCWRRENRRCDKKSFKYHKSIKKSTHTTTEHIASNHVRVRRDPGFFDFFNRDAYKDIFGVKGERYQCRPYESSFSDDCPPADWCTGCKVCDCDGKGRWNCHILQFCPENTDKDKKPIDNSKRIINKKPLPNSNLNNTTKRIAPNVTGPMKRGVSKKIVTTKNKYLKKSISRVKKSVNKTQTNKNVGKATKRIYLKPKTKYFKKNMTTTIPKKTKISQLTGDKDNEALSLESQVMQNVMAAVRKIINTELRNMTTYVSKFHKLPTPTTKSSAYKVKYNKKLFKREDGQAHSNMRSNRLKRALEDQEEALQRAILSANNSDAANAIPTTDLLFPDDDDYFTLPMLVIKNNEDKYYKYFVSSLLKNNESTDNSHNATAMYIPNTSNVTEVTANILKPVTVNENETETVEPKSNYKEYILKEIEPSVLIEIKNGTVKALSVTNQTDVTTKNVSKNNFGADTPVRVIINDFLLNKTDADPKTNESKYNQWVYLKNKSEMESQNSNNIIVTKPVRVHANKNKRKHVSRINVSKKINLYRMLNYHKCPYLNNILKNKNETRYKIRGSLEDIFKKKFNGTKKTHKKHNKVSVILYIRKILDSLFKKNINYEPFNRRRVLQSLCKNFGPCNFDRKNKHILSSKLADLDHETVSILKAVNIIKGLLILLDNNTESIKSSSKGGRLGYNIERLNNILKGNYTNLTNEPLTETKVSQLDLIKKNIENFVESVRKFTTLLNDIILILTKRDKNSNGKHTDKRLFHHESNEMDFFQNLKYTLLKYNLIQNNFIKKMYEMINNFDSKTTEKQKVSYDEDIKNNEAYTNLSRNILENLKKLKHLAQTLSNKRSKRAVQKDEPIEYLLLLMEYLLKQHQPYDVHPVNDGIDLLIEAIKNAPDVKTVRKKVLTNTNFTQNSTKLLHRSAIENKSNNNEAGIDTTSYEDSSKNLNDVSAGSLDGKLIENKDIFEIIDEEKESEEKLQFDRRSDHTAFETTEPSGVSMFSYADEQENPFFEDVRTSPTLLEKITTSIFNGSTDLSNDIESGSDDENDNKNIKENDNKRRYNDNKVYINQFTEKVYTYEPLDEGKLSNSQTHSMQVITEKTEKNNYEVTDKSTTPVTEESVEKEDSHKNIETIFAADIEEDEATSRKFSSTATELTTTASSETDSPLNKDITITDKTLNKNARIIVDKKSKLEWIEENFQRDYTNYDDEKDVIKTSTTVNDNQNTNKVDVSSISNEVENGPNRKKKSKITKDVMLRKQMDLMNSLDYGTEKIELDDVDTTEVNIDDRESDSSYFVQ